MEFVLDHAAFRTRRLIVETGGWLRGPRLLVGGTPARRDKGRYLVTSDAGHEVPVELKHNYFDPVPRVRVGDQSIELVRRLTWYEHAWIAVPIMLVLVGGMIGGIVGMVAAYASARVFRADLNPVARYGYTGLISLGAMVAFAILATLAHILIHGAP